MREIYGRQRRFFREAYQTGRHGWPSEEPTAEVGRLVLRLGPGRGRAALDLGCGEGRHSVLLARRGFEVTGLDLEPRALGLARRRLRKEGLDATFVTGDALHLRFPPDAFDLVLDYGCFHHLVTRDWTRYRAGIARVLRPGGRFILSVFSTKFRHHPDERRSRNWVVHRNHYDHFFTARELREAFSRDFDCETLLEEHEGLSGFYHALFRKR